MQLQGRVAFVTGAASGLGLATCRVLNDAGARIIATDIDASALEQAVEPLGSGVHALTLDVSDEKAIGAAVARTLELEGALHVLVNCAGILGPSKTISRGQLFPVELWEKVLAVNLSGSFHAIRHAALAMTRNDPDDSGERGVIINTASGAAWQGQMGQAAYSASKAAVVGMTLPIARDLAEHGIRVVSIAPGLFETGMSAAMPPKVSQNLIDNMVLFPRRMGQPPEFAGLVRHIVENPYLNATTISVDGGGRVGTR